MIVTIILPLGKKMCKNVKKKGDEWVPPAPHSEWGVTRFACKYIPSQRYRPHLPLDDRQRRRVFVDVVDNRALDRSYGDATVEIVSESTGEVHGLRSMRGASVFRSDGASELLYTELRVPDVYSLRVTKAR